MYYLELIQRFWDFNQKAQLNTTSITFYLYLLNLASNNNGYDVVISDVAISNALGITRKTVKSTKEKLQILGLIRYENKKGLPSSYRVVLDYPISPPEFDKTEKLEFESGSNVPEVERTDDLPLYDLLVQNIDNISKPEDGTPVSDVSKPPISNDQRPSFDEFLEYAQTLAGYEISLDSAIKDKYDSWVENDWKNASGRPVNNWKSSLKGTFPFMKNKTVDRDLSIRSIPNIERP
ncbi:hypothetical protein [Chryseobacterium mulctrae]|uniref:hypothetical protein n=1 Tax=Chryseobacterium mulctrae TaxID=2576777 RepID=UPI00111759C4|nr:hypothetical protein [Chryseobacterium mulctrae]